jgi:hypothetical protein
MTIWPHRVYWRGHLRWYERACLVLWWLSLAFVGACIGVAAAILYTIGFSRVAVEAAAAVMLAGFIVVTAARLLLAAATRKSRRRRVDVY